MNDSRAIQNHLAQAAASLIPGEQPPEAIHVTPRGTVFDAAFVYPDTEHRFVVKPLAPDQHVHEPSRLRDIQSALRQHQPALRDAIIPIDHVEPDRRWIIMPRADGPTFETLLRDALRQPARFNHDVTTCLNHTARILAALHRIPAARFNLQPASHHNREYLPALEDCWHHRLPRRCLPPHITGAELFQRLCTHDFRSRLGDRLLPADVQPKNQIVTRPGRVTLVDPDYNAGNPAMTLVGFLLALDRLALRRPFASTLRHIDAWKRYFLHAYAAAGESWAVDDARLLYPWALLRTFDHHAHARPAFRPYLAMVYGRTLRTYLHYLDNVTTQPDRALAA